MSVDQVFCADTYVADSATELRYSVLLEIGLLKPKWKWKIFPFSTTIITIQNMWSPYRDIHLLVSGLYWHPKRVF